MPVGNIEVIAFRGGESADGHSCGPQAGNYERLNGSATTTPLGSSITAPPETRAVKSSREVGHEGTIRWTHRGLTHPWPSRPFRPAHPSNLTDGGSG